MEKINKYLNNLLWLAPPVAIIILLLMNDVTSFSAKEEVNLIRDVQLFSIESVSVLAGETPLFPKLLLAPVYDNYNLNEFALRFPGLAFVVVILLIWWFFGKKLLGENTLNAGILVLCSTLLLPNIIKYATSDAWLLGWQALHWLSLLYLLKKPGFSWQIAYFFSLLMGLLVAPFPMGLWAFVLLVFYRFRHQEGKPLNKLIIPVALLSLLFYFWTYSQGWAAPLLVSLGSLGILGWLGAQLGGFIPWMGFMFAGVKESYDKFKRGEELSVLMVGALMAGILSGGLILQWVLALLAGKQLLSYFHPKYPYGRWVKGGAVLIVVMACLVATGSMIWGYAQFDFTGYRAFMMTGGLFWMLSLLGVIGLYIFNYRIIPLAFIMSGLLLNFGLWYRIGPIAEQSRGWVKNVVTELAMCQKENQQDSLLVIGEEIPDKVLSLYSQSNFSKISFHTDQEAENFNYSNFPFLLINSNLAEREDIRAKCEALSVQSSIFQTIPEVFYKNCQ